MNDFNARIIEEFRANEGRVGGPFEGAPMVLVHHVGRRSGEERVSPLVYRPDPADDDTLYIFASAAGAPKHPAWFHNLVEAGHGRVEVGTETYDVDVREVTGSQRDEIYAAQAADMPGFAEYEEKTAGLRTIPVVALHRRAA